MSQEELARDAECPVRTIRRLENGETKRPQLETVVRLCVALSLRWRLGEALLVRYGWVLRAGVYEDEVLRYVLEHCTDMALAVAAARCCRDGGSICSEGVRWRKKFLVFNAKRDV